MSTDMLRRLINCRFIIIIIIRAIKRLYRNARREQKLSEMSDDGDALFSDGVLLYLYTLKDGYVGHNTGNVQRTAIADSHGVN